MKLTKTPGRNEIKWEGLTIGKLMAIQAALEAGTLGPIGKEVLYFLQNAKIEEVESFGNKWVYEH